MAPGVLVASAATTLAAAAANAYVALRLWRDRGLSDRPAQLALRLLALWWALTAANQALGSGVYLLAAGGVERLDVQVAYAVVQRLLLALSLVGLMGYLSYVFQGRHHLAGLGLVYAAFYAFQLWILFVAEPVGVRVTGWRTDLAYAGVSPAWALLVSFAWLVLPPVGGAAAYLALARHAEDPARRRRIVIVSVGIILWWIVAVVAGQRATLEVDALQLVNRVMGVAVAFGILVAYDPPPWAQRRLGLRPYGAAA